MCQVVLIKIVFSDNFIKLFIIDIDMSLRLLNMC